MKEEELDVLTYFRNYREEDLLLYDELSYCLISDPAIKIAPDGWSRWNDGTYGGKSALSYLCEAEGYDREEALSHLGRIMNVLPPVKSFPGRGSFPRLPWENLDSEQIRAFLVEKKGISAALTDRLIEDKWIYEERYTHHIILPCFDREGRTAAAWRCSIPRGTFQRVKGSRRGYSFLLEGDDSEEFHLFDSPYELLEFYGREVKNSLFLGESENTETFFLPLIPLTVSRDRPRTLILHFEDSEQGRRNRECLCSLLGKNMEIRDYREEPGREPGREEKE